MNKLLLLAMTGALVYLNLANPGRADHEAFLLAEAQARAPLAGEQSAALLEELDYSNFMICSATKTALDSKMVTFGYLNRVTLINEPWLAAITGRLQGASR